MTRIAMAALAVLLLAGCVRSAQQTEHLRARPCTTEQRAFQARFIDPRWTRWSCEQWGYGVVVRDLDPDHHQSFFHGSSR